ncbi:MAG: hypothetical protein K2Y21_04070 [Phycisphaerales bacterium]|nr:hypothetical protein [Phycisphaerales bacterium]
MGKFYAVCAIASMAGAAAQASMISHFDNYSNGQSLHNIDGWKGWNNVSSVAGIVSSVRAYSGTNSLAIAPGNTDAVRLVSNATSGIWNITAMQYIASGQSGLTYFILMNKYQDNANTSSDSWSVQMKFDLANGTVRDDFRGGSVAIQYNAWVQIQVQVDLNANTVSQYYNGTLVASGAWKRGAGSLNAIQAVDLYNNGNNTTYYDDVSVQSAASPNVPAPGAIATTGLAMLLMAPRRKR